MTGGLEARYESQDPQKGEEYSLTDNEWNADAEYVIDQIFDHGFKEEKLIFKVRWYGYTIEEATWEPVEQLTCSAEVTYFRRKRLPLHA